MEEAQKAIETLESPDINSGDQDNEGRRIERVPGGWIVLNAPKYRAIVTRVNQQERTKERVRKFRAAKKDGNAFVTECNAYVTPSESESESESNTETYKGEKKKALPHDSGSELMLANWLLEELGVVADNGVRRVVADAIRLLAKEGGSTKDAADYILAAGREAVVAGEVITRFWFTDQKYRPAKPVKSKRQREREARSAEFLAAGTDEEL